MRDIDLWKVATVKVGDPVSEVRAKIADADLDIALLVDEGNRPVGWLSEGAFRADRIRHDIRSPAVPLVELDDILRDALSDLLASETRWAPVVDARGGVTGVLSLEVISHVLHDHQASLNVPDHADLLSAS